MIDDKSPPGSYLDAMHPIVASSVIYLPFPPTSLSGHNNGHWIGKSGIVALHRSDAFALAKQARVKVPVDGDIRIAFYFTPPDDRGDRVNFPIRLKPAIDGIAQALGVNDKRFLPSYYFNAPNKDRAGVAVVIGSTK